jgi:hypothetical protein
MISLNIYKQIIAGKSFLMVKRWQGIKTHPVCTQKCLHESKVENKLIFYLIVQMFPSLFLNSLREAESSTFFYCVYLENINTL